MAQGREPKAFRSLLLLPCPGMGRGELPWDSPWLFRLRCCSPRERLGFWVQFFCCSFGWVLSVAGNGASVTVGPFPAFSGKLLLKNITPQPLALRPPRVLCAQTDHLVKCL